MTGMTIVLSLALGAGAAAAPQQHDHGAPSDGKLGTVAFATSCSAAAQPQFNRAVALLHSFEFGRAIDAFTATLKSDPSCAMAEWGIALSRWSNPFVVGIRPPAALQPGRDAVERARTIGAKTERERAYVDAVAQLYEHFDTIDQRSHRPVFKAARAPVLDRWTDDHAIIVAEIRDDGDRPEVVDRTQWRARNLDPDMHLINQLRGFLEREVTLARGRCFADPKKEFRFPCSKSLVEHGHCDRRAVDRDRVAREDGSRESVGSKLLDERRRDATHFPPTNGAIP